MATFFKQVKKLGDILLEYELVSQAQLDTDLKVQRETGKRLGDVLVSINALTPTQLAEMLAIQFDFQFVQLDRYQVQPEAIKLIPKAVAERLSVIPLEIDADGTLVVTMADPLDLPSQDEIKMLTGHNLRVTISGRDDIKRNLHKLYDQTTNLEGVKALSEAAEAEAYTPLAATTIVAGPDDAPLIELVNDTISQAVREEASDIHIEAYERTCRIRFRVDGNLYVHLEYPPNLHPSVVSRIKIMSGMDITEKRRPQDGRILTVVNNKHIDLRVSSLPTMGSEKIVLRILDRDHAAVDLERLGFDDDDMKYINKFCEMPCGIMLATGPTGSGKSTTLYSMLR
ncbi:MAG: Flp pilus assembly complex ATPase component TadA, partial [Synergistaceae bacterium]|nr:Flp pilus assembly complex ATPase component TadA [Synergistaceae bacterium]